MLVEANGERCHGDSGTSQTKCYDQPPGFYYGSRYTQWKFHDNFGVVHGYNLIFTNCVTDEGPHTAIIDGIKLDADAGTVTLASGKVVTPPQNAQTGSATAMDTNGNYISIASNTITDTLGSTALTITGSPSPTAFVYPGPHGNQTVSVNYLPYNIKTNFGCTGITEYNATGVSLISSIGLPDGSSYSFSYEGTPGNSGYYTGRISSITLPTGGTITYTYNSGTNDGTSCSDGSSVYLKKQTPDTGSGAYWLYQRTNPSGTNWQTTVTDPSSTPNQSVLNFQAVTDSNGLTNFYQTKALTYTGSTSGTLLQTADTCYIATAPDSTGSCTSATITPPITQIDNYRRLPSKTGGPTAMTTTKYDSTYQRVTEVDEYDFGSVTSGTYGSLVRKTTTSYASLGNGIVSRPYQVSVYDGSSNLKAQTTYTYDGGTLTTPSGTTPQHLSFGGSRGNATQISYLVHQGSTTLSKNFTYYDTGGLHTSSDFGGAHTTTYQLGANTTANCGNTFPVEVDMPLSLTTYASFDCNGAVLTGATDPNGNNSTVTYYDASNTPTLDPFWRPIYSTDAALNKTYFTYTTTSAESKLTFNGGTSVVDQLTTLDTTGRVHVAQKRQGPSATYYDSVETDYDPLGRAYRSTIPYKGTSGQTASSPQWTTASFDGAGRRTEVQDAGTGTVTNAFNSGSISYYSDVLTTVGPAPTGEHAKQRQMEYDGLGRLTSVCELTTMTGYGTCGQNYSQSGYWTRYRYDTLGNLSGVCQNTSQPPSVDCVASPSSGQQTRTYTFDALGRLTSETNPENGTTSYVYDTDSTCGTSNGDLVKKTDSITPTHNVTCYAYDALHRLTDVTYPTGSYSSITPAKHFVYDSATVNGAAMSNAKTRLAEAYTGTSGSKITDLGFSYSVRGEITDVYQKTPNSGSYYHLTAAYWEHGALKQLSGLSGVPTLTWGMDGEGRVSGITGGTTSPVTSVSYDVNLGALTGITYGSTTTGNDTDTFGFDTSTLRLTSYEYDVNGVADKAQLTWNKNGSFQTLAITDNISGSGDTQTCNYTHDDLGRIQKVDCGSAFEQDFSFDAFGNVNKRSTGNWPTFTPTYSASTNQINGGGLSATYDANGNLTNDGAASSPQTYTWDADNHPHTLRYGSNSIVTVTHDALGRAVENLTGSSNYQQIVYAPGGFKLALMNGTTLVKAWVPLQGGGKAVYNSTGLAYYQHGDWLGTSRLTSTPARTAYITGAYAPFGEDYAHQNSPVDFSFTGQTQDTLAGNWNLSTQGGELYDFMFRRYHPVQGRWISPDPLGSRAVELANPQTWNRYAYVANSPARLVDQLGFCPNVDYSDALYERTITPPRSR